MRYSSPSMQLTEELRLPDRAERLFHALDRTVQPGRSYRLMEFCGGHTHALCHFGLLDRLPSSIRMIHGPGCPVCVLPIGRLQQAIDLAIHQRVMLCSYGDLLRVKGRSHQSLQSARSLGADVRVVYGPMDALALAKKHPDREVVFLAVGFETTTPMTAATVEQARKESIRNFSVLCNHVLTPAALSALLSATKDPVQVDGFIGPGHVAAVIGSDAFSAISQTFSKPIVIAGFEPIDLLASLLHLIELLNQGQSIVLNDFARAATPEGNRRAQAIIHQVMELRDSFAWRGLGELANSALRLRDSYRDYDAEHRFSLSTESIPDHRACRCPDVLRGSCIPTDCTLFGTACTPDSPLGSCMVSAEGACAAYFLHRPQRLLRKVHVTSSPSTP